jgi:phosphoacetylglucosamine mutase
LNARVYVGRDTRPSSSLLKDHFARGVAACGGVLLDQGIVTTPQLHYITAHAYTGSIKDVPTYYTDLCTAFRALLRKDQGEPLGWEDVFVDCANGVGQLSANEFKRHLEGVLGLHTLNTNTSGLNAGCGAEFVQSKKKVPAEFDAKVHGTRKCASVDGDADRLVYYYTDVEGTFHLLDGDKLIALYTGFLRELLQASELACTLGIVQTAYANGASTIYMSQELKADVCFTKTGVKHLHHRAEDFDVGVYFEANGHGTVLFSARALDMFAKGGTDGSLTDTARQACVDLLNVSRLVNQSCGDAFSDLLMAEVILSRRGWSLADWNALYTDLPSRMLKVVVPDRTAVTTTNAERTCVTPEGMQAAIDALVGSEVGRRSFVRPSGTEDVVRVYAEAATQADADALAASVSEAVARLCSR